MGINLLPPEIVERRQAEKRLAVVILLTIVYVVILFLVYLFLQAKVYQETLVLRDLQTQNRLINRQIDEFKVFEERKNLVDKHRQVIEQALAGEVSWYQMLLELSMIIPSDVSIESFTGDTVGGITMSGKARSYLSVAKWLVRLNELESISNVWLDSVSKTEGEVSFSITAQLKGGAETGG
jgi:Tfp pilus assembly protein PilN